MPSLITNPPFPHLLANLKMNKNLNPNIMRNSILILAAIFFASFFTSCEQDSLMDDMQTLDQTTTAAEKTEPEMNSDAITSIDSITAAALWPGNVSKTCLFVRQCYVCKKVNSLYRVYDFSSKNTAVQRKLINLFRKPDVYFDVQANYF